MYLDEATSHHSHDRDLVLEGEREASSEAEVKRDDETIKTSSPNVGCFRQFEQTTIKE